MASEKKLTPKQDRFCREYVIDLNATQAAIRAGYSAKTASRIAAKLVVKSCIQKKVNELKTKVAKKAELTAEDVIKGIREIAELRVDGKLVKLSDKLRAYELLGKHLTLFTENHKHEHSGEVSFRMVLQPSKE